MTHQQEVQSGERFPFGRNWAQYVAHLDTRRVEEARQSLARWLGPEPIAGSSFIDVGSGSGLFSLAARQLGARVLSFDYDPDSVNCAIRLREQLGGGDGGWNVQSGSVLDRDFLSTLGQHDIVYSWGVLHHTGAMYEALDNVVPLVAPRGRLFIAI